MTKLEAMRHGGKINGQVMRKLFETAVPGVGLKELDTLAEELVKKENAVSSFKDYDGFPASICTNINNGLIHGLPTDYKLKMGDTLTIDQGVYFGGFHTDHACSILVGDDDDREISTFLNVGKEALVKAIEQAKVGNKVGDISNAMQTVIEKAGYFVVKSYVGHGVGIKLHESPQIPCQGKPDTGSKLTDSQTLAIEVMYTSNKSHLSISSDGWTVEAKDAKFAGLFEKTIMVRRNKPIVLT